MRSHSRWRFSPQRTICLALLLAAWWALNYMRTQVLRKTESVARPPSGSVKDVVPVERHHTTTTEKPSRFELTPPGAVATTEENAVNSDTPKILKVVENKENGAVSSSELVYESTPSVRINPRQYAFGTLVLTSPYSLSALVLCDSFRTRSKTNDNFPDVDVVAFLPKNYKERNIDVRALLCCFDKVILLDRYPVSVLPMKEAFQEQYIKLRLWSLTMYKSIMFMDADFLVRDSDKIIKVLRSNTAKFAAVEDFNQGQISPWWNGGFITLVPSHDTYSQLSANVEPFIQKRLFDVNIAEQGYLSAFFRNKNAVTLDHTYNLNLAMAYQNKEMWEKYAKDAAAIHFTWEKPWTADYTWFPFDVWREQKASWDKHKHQCMTNNFRMPYRT